MIVIFILDMSYYVAQAGPSPQGSVFLVSARVDETIGVCQHAWHVLYSWEVEGNMGARLRRVKIKIMAQSSRTLGGQATQR